MYFILATRTHSPEICKTLGGVIAYMTFPINYNAWLFLTAKLAFLKHEKREDILRSERLRCVFGPPLHFFLDKVEERRMRFVFNDMF